MKSIRRNLVLGLTSALILLILVAGFALYGVLRRILRSEFDAGLRSKARALVMLTEAEDDGEVEFEFSDQRRQPFRRHREADYFALWLAGGRLLARSPTLDPSSLPRPAGTLEAPVYQDLQLPDGRNGRAISFWFTPEAEDDHELPSDLRVGMVVARSREELDGLLTRILLSICVAGTALPIGVALIVNGGVRRGLGPLERMARETATIDPRSIQHRFQRASLPEELRPIAHRLDELLQRIDAAFRRERRFTSDVAHELRTPIAELRSTCEVALMPPGDAESHERATRDCLRVAEQMERLVEMLLGLSRCDEGQQVVRVDWMDPAGQLRRAWELHERMAARRKLTARWQRHSRVPPVLGDPLLIASILSNLVGNAVSHAPEASEIVLTVEAEERAVRVSIANDAPELTRSDLAHLSEPFWQKNEARSASEHNGLGLTLVSALCGLMGMGFNMDLADTQRLIISLEFSRSLPAEESSGGSSQVPTDPTS